MSKLEFIFVSGGRWSVKTVIGVLRDVASADWDTAVDLGEIAETKGYRNLPLTVYLLSLTDY